MLKLLKYFRLADWVLSLVIVAGVVAQAWMEIELVKRMGEIIGLIQDYASGFINLTSNMLWEVALKMIMLAFGILGCVILVSCMASYIASHFSKRIRTNLFKKVNRFSVEEINNFSTASLITRTTNDVKQVEQSVFMFLRMAIFAPTLALFALREIIGTSTQLSWAMAAAVGLMLALVLFMFFVAVPKFSKIQKKTDSLNLVAREGITGIRVVRAYNAEMQQQEKFEKVNKDLTKTNLFVQRASSFLFPGMMLIMNLLNLAIYWIGAYLINSNVLQYEILINFTMYAMQVLMSFIFITMLFVIIPRGVVSAKRINEVLKTSSKITDGHLNSKLHQQGSVEFKNVSFAYPNAEVNVLENISFVANQGQTVAFIGSTGSGKSTLINLIPRFFDATEGEILVNGVNVKDYKLEQLNNLIGYVPQKGYLFSGTIESNIKFANENITQEEIEQALKVAQAKFVYELEDNINHQISQGGTNLSGGQRQRICIARAVAKNPQIYIFDDSFSALDYKTDKALRKSLKKETKNAIKLIVAQRIGTIMDADKIIVLEEGKMVGVGTHQELLKNCLVYKDIALSQLSKEEL